MGPLLFAQSPFCPRQPADPVSDVKDRVPNRYLFALRLQGVGFPPSEGSLGGECSRTVGIVWGLAGGKRQAGGQGPGKRLMTARAFFWILRAAPDHEKNAKLGMGGVCYFGTESGVRSLLNTMLPGVSAHNSVNYEELLIIHWKLVVHAGALMGTRPAAGPSSTVTCAACNFSRVQVDNSFTDPQSSSRMAGRYCHGSKLKASISTPYTLFPSVPSIDLPSPPHYLGLR